MQQARKTLSPRAASPREPAADPSDILASAISLRLCALAVYNKALVKFAPHILYTRHDDPFVDAVVIERDGKAPREVKLGVFKLAGLTDVRLTANPFEPFAGFDPAAPLYAGTTIQAIQP